MRVSALTHSGPVQNRSTGVSYSQQLSVRSFINNNYYSNNTWTKPRGLNIADTVFAGGPSSCEVDRFLKKEGVTLLTNVVIGGGTLIKAGLGAAGAFGEGAEPALPSSFAGRAALNAPSSAAGAVVTALNGNINASLGVNAGCSCGG
jgi:hypothetical protein